MNPAGVLIGPDAHLNLPGSVTVTTADAIAFDQGNFYATGENTYTALSQSPTGSLTFSNASPGSIVNEGDISVAPGETVTLTGGAVVSTGELSAPEGSVTVAAIPSESTVKITQPGSLLSLEIDPIVPIATDSTATDSNVTISPLDLPSLLVASEHKHADSLSVNSDGSVSLTANTANAANAESQFSIGAGSTVVSGSITVDNFSANTASGQIAILGERVILTDAMLSASGQGGGGNINIGGAHKGHFSLPSAHETFVSADTQISADALTRGDGGNVVVWADDTTQYLGDISAVGGLLEGDGGFIEVSGKETLSFDGAVDTRAPQGISGTLLLDPSNILIFDSESAADDEQILDGEVLATDSDGVFRISAAALNALSAESAITLEATNNIIVQNLANNALTFAPGSSAITFAADTDNNGIGNIVFRDLNDAVIAPGRSLNFSGNALRLGDISTVADNRGGDVNVNAATTVRVSDIDTFAVDGEGGEVIITGNDDITAQVIRTKSSAPSGDVTVSSQLGDITIQQIVASTSNNLNISTLGDISIQGMTLPSFLATLPTVPAPGEGGEGEDTEDSNSENSALSSRSTVDVLIAQLAALGEVATADNASSATVQSATATRSDASQYGVQRTQLSNEEASAIIAALDGFHHQAFSDYFGRDMGTTERSLEDIQALLAEAERRSGQRSAVVYVQVPPAKSDGANDGLDGHGLGGSGFDSGIGNSDEQSNDELTLLLLTAEDAPLKLSLSAVGREALLDSVDDFRADLITSARRGANYYLKPAQQLYDWLIAPMEDDLSAANIDTLVFAMDEGLRTLPVAALHSGASFLVEEYSLGMVPSVGMLDPQYVSLAEAQVLSMGMSDFSQHEGLSQLPGVPVEVDAIAASQSGDRFLNEQVTRQRLIRQRQQVPYSVVHLATHAEFNPGRIEDSYIQLWDEALSLGDLHQLGWQSPALDLLVLSACNTALGSPEAEMGFAGLAIASGARSAMASLWSVSDVGTLALMNEFYAQLGNAPTKSSALQQAQRVLLQGDVRIDSGQLMGSELAGSLDLPSDLEPNFASDFSHPYFWSSFTMIGSPW